MKQLKYNDIHLLNQNNNYRKLDSNYFHSLDHLQNEILLYIYHNYDYLYHLLYYSFYKLNGMAYKYYQYLNNILQDYLGIKTYYQMNNV